MSVAVARAQEEEAKLKEQSHHLQVKTVNHQSLVN
jgi:hypothetical protein